MYASRTELSCSDRGRGDETWKGRWAKALQAAGIDHEAATKRRTWTVDRVVKAIRDLDRRRVALNCASILNSPLKNGSFVTLPQGSA